MFYPRSPRAVGTAVAARLARLVPRGVETCGLFVDPNDGEIEAVLEALPLGILQLHGSETPERAAAIRERFRLPVMKALSIAGRDDVAAAERWFGAVDRLLFDAKAGNLPGGNGQSFDWTLLAGRSWPLPWLLAGGLTADNLAEAVRATGARAVDVSSGVETSPGIKDPGKIAAFLTAARAID